MQPYTQLSLYTLSVCLRLLQSLQTCCYRSETQNSRLSLAEQSCTALSTFNTSLCSFVLERKARESAETELRLLKTFLNRNLRVIAPSWQALLFFPFFLFSFNPLPYFALRVLAARNRRLQSFSELFWHNSVMVVMPFLSHHAHIKSTSCQEPLLRFLKRPAHDHLSTSLICPNCMDSAHWSKLLI